nr:Os01g0794900 [Ipomoea trifida]GMD00171.1 Oxoglutarate/iron-dependent dioxygenase [Ipomoea batatas]
METTGPTFVTVLDTCRLLCNAGMVIDGRFKFTRKLDGAWHGSSDLGIWPSRREECYLWGDLLPHNRPWKAELYNGIAEAEKKIDIASSNAASMSAELQPPKDQHTLYAAIRAKGAPPRANPFASSAKLAPSIDAPAAVDDV